MIGSKFIMENIFELVWMFDFKVLIYLGSVSYTHLRAHETVLDLVCRLLLEKKIHKESFSKIKKQIKKRFPKLKVELNLISLDSKITKF